MILELDVGNSRIKWRHFSSVHGETVLSGHTVELNEIPAMERDNGRFSRIRLASVRDLEKTARISKAMEERWGITPEVATVKSHCAGVSNSYKETEKMGVDRWLAMLAAFHRAGEACLVVDCGTALTVDMLDDKGHHLGGYIVPGLELSRKALLSNTGIRVDTAFRNDSITPGTFTESAIAGGTLAMLTALIEASVRRGSASARGTSHCFLTGGDATVLVQHLRLENCTLELAPDLVLDGLQFALP